MSESQPPQTPDFSAFGSVESRPLTRMQVLVATAMERSWTSIPHVNHQEEADITALEALRAKRSAQGATKISLLPFYVRAAVAALKQFPNVNASLDGAKKALILKQYYHIGIAVDVPAGLLVPVVRDADKKSIDEIGQEITDLAQLARTKGLPLAKMSGGCFTISSLGAVGGTAFTPIINPPELAIMGISRSYRKPFEAAGGIEWRTVLPFSLSYDHRAVNGTVAGNFCRTFADSLSRPEEL